MHAEAYIQILFCSGQKIMIWILEMEKTLSSYPISNLVSLLESSNFSQSNVENELHIFKNMLFKKRFKVFLKENSIKKWKWNFFSTNRKSALDMIWHQDKHWKSSTGSTLEGFKLGLVIFDDMDDFLSKIWDTCQIRSKRWIWDFFIYPRILASRSKIFLW